MDDEEGETCDEDDQDDHDIGGTPSDNIVGMDVVAFTSDYTQQARSIDPFTLGQPFLVPQVTLPDLLNASRVPPPGLPPTPNMPHTYAPQVQDSGPKRKMSEKDPEVIDDVHETPELKRIQNSPTPSRMAGTPRQLDLQRSQAH